MGTLKLFLGPETMEKKKVGWFGMSILHKMEDNPDMSEREVVESFYPDMFEVWKEHLAGDGPFRKRVVRYL